MFGEKNDEFQKPQLFLFHFAGGNTYSFNFLIPYLSDLEIIPLELPGRGKRLKEELLKDFNHAALDLYEKIVEKRKNSNFILYGHSMGAELALNVTKLLEDNGTAPLYLIVSGNAGPEIDKRSRHLLNKQDFMEELIRLGGVTREFMDNRELFDFFEPILRSDFQIAESQEPSKSVKVDVPIFAIMGREEENSQYISNWSTHTRRRFDFEILEGSHFFIYDHPLRIANVIRNCYLQSYIR